jgi:hypothetical protein
VRVLSREEVRGGVRNFKTVRYVGQVVGKRHPTRALLAVAFGLLGAGCGSTARATAPAHAPVSTTSAVASSSISPSSKVAVQQSSGSCAFSFTDRTLAERAWAFDGTATRESTGLDSHLGGVQSTTFRVNHWYKGGSAAAVTVEFSFGRSEDQTIDGGIGTRLLVTGEPRWGGQPLDNPVAWGCGFTQVWTADGAQHWSAVFGASPERHICRSAVARWT